MNYPLRCGISYNYTLHKIGAGPARPKSENIKEVKILLDEAFGRSGSIYNTLQQSTQLGKMTLSQMKQTFCDEFDVPYEQLGLPERGGD